jgi:hypothetical protein
MASILGTIHGDNFVPQCPWGDKGDLSCDGYLRDPQTVFACYGRENGEGDRRPGGIVGKVRSDFLGALAKWPGLKEWVFVSNIVDGMPAVVTQALEALQAEHGVRFGYFGLDGMKRRLLEMDEEVIEDLVDPIHTRGDFIHLQPVVVQEVIGNVAAEFNLSYLDVDPKPVPPHKLALNQIPGCHAAQIRSGRLGRETVAACVEGSADPVLGTRLSEAFRARYAELRFQDLSPGDIMDCLFDFALAGQEAPTTAHRAAAWAVLSYLFDMCDIFEDKPWRSVA